MSRSFPIRLWALVLIAIAIASCGRDSSPGKEALLQKGDQLAAEGNFQPAIIEYRNAIRLDERFGLARYKLALAYAAVDDWQRARAEFVRAADLLPGDVDVQVAAAQALLRFGEFQDAAARASLALKIDPKSTTALLVRGSAAAGLKDFDGAMKTFEEGLAADQNRMELHVNIGAIQRLQGNQAEAEASFKRAVTVSPQSLRARMTLANYYWATARVAEAEEALGEALKLQPDDITVNRALAAFYVATNRPLEAEAPLRRAASASSALEPQLVLADYLSAQRRYADALPILDKVASQPEGFAPANSRRAAIEYQLGRREQAYTILEQVLAKEPKNVRVLVLKATWLATEKQFERAQATAEMAVAADPETWVAHDLLGMIHASRRHADEAAKSFTEALRLNPRALTTQVALANLNLAEGRAEAGIRFAEEAVRAEPNSGQARVTLVKALLADGEVARARIELQPLLKGLSDAGPVHALLGDLEMREGNYKAAAAAYERAAALEPTSAEALAGLIRLDLAERNFARAIERVEAFTRRAPRDSRAFFLAAQTYAAAGKAGDAEVSAKQTIELDPDYLEAYALLAQLYVRQKKLDAARLEFERIIARDPGDIGAHTMIGIVLQVQQKHEDAKKVYQRVLGLDPRAVVAANNLAYTYATEGRNLDVALNLAQTAKVGRPDDPDVNDTLGWILLKRNLPSLAIEPLELSVRKVPGNATYRYHLGMAYLQAGDRARGREALEHALRLQSDFEGASDARKALSGLRDEPREKVAKTPPSAAKVSRFEDLPAASALHITKM